MQSEPPKLFVRFRSMRLLPGFRNEIFLVKDLFLNFEKLVNIRDDAPNFHQLQIFAKRCTFVGDLYVKKGSQKVVSMHQKLIYY